MGRAAQLHEAVAFDENTGGTDGYGGLSETWVERFTCRAEFVYAGGGETVLAARLAGQSIFKVKIRSSEAARAITADYRMRDARRGVSYNVREVDAVTDRSVVWLLVESGVAV